MDEHRIYLHELAILMIWVCAPALVTTVAAQLWWFMRRRVFQRGQLARVAIALVGTVALTPIAAVFFWAILPKVLLPDSVVPEGSIPIPPFFLPAILACSILGSALGWWVIRQRSA